MRARPPARDDLGEIDAENDGHDDGRERRVGEIVAAPAENLAPRDALWPVIAHRRLSMQVRRAAARQSSRIASQRAAILPRTIMRRFVKLTSSRSCPRTSQP